MLDAVHRLDNKRRLTVKGSGQIVLTPHNKNSRRVKPEKVTGLKTVIENHAAQLNLPFPHRLSNTLLKFTSGVKINGRPWKKGVHCLYYLPTDRRVDDLPRIGKVLFFILEPIGRSEHLFVVVDDRRVVDRRKSIVVFDVSRPARQTIFHVDHLTHLVGSLPYFHAGRLDIRCGVTIAPTL